MKPAPPAVAFRPVRPLMIYDGDCNFCGFWIRRWHSATAGQVDFVAAQDPRVRQHFPELGPERLAESVQLVETDGRLYEGAEAVFRALAQNRRQRWPWWCYRRVPCVAAVTEAGYRVVASNRGMFTALTRMFWGQNAAPSEHRFASWLFLRLLGVIYLCAFWSLGTQILGLVGSHGILPAAQWMDVARDYFDRTGVGWDRFREVPTLCWWSASDPFLKFLCGAGSAVSLLLIFNVAPALCLALLWVIYLSLASVCGIFLGYQWDILLLEAGLLAILLAPLQFRPRLRDLAPPSRVSLWLLRWLLFRLMFESGLVKLLSRDPNWSHLRALNYHYETQPLPTWIGWYAHQLPADVQSACVFIMFVIELAVPFLIFMPRRLRQAGCALLVLLQVLIFLTGNYCFFNLLTIAMCLLLLDDAALVKILPVRWRHRFISGTGEAELPVWTAVQSPKAETGSNSISPAQPTETIAKPARRWPLWVTLPSGVVILLVTVTQLFGMLAESDPRPLRWAEEWLGPFRSLNTYGLFMNMTTTRPVIIIEGSNDGMDWREYEFKYQSGDVKRRPGFVAPHQPRLDWQMWFAALDVERGQREGWLGQFLRRLLEGSPEVVSLLGRNPFPDAPPRYIRARLYEYHFTNFKERAEIGAWWRRELAGEIIPPTALPGR